MRVAIFSKMDEPDRLAPRRVLDAFVAGLDGGLFGRASVADAAVTVQLLPEHRLVADVLTGTITQMSPPDFCVIASMVSASVPGATGVEIVERCSNERVLVVQSLAPDPEATILEVDFRISFRPAVAPGITVRFVDPPAPDVVRRAGRILGAWAELVTLGAFPPATGCAASGRLLSVTACGQDELRAVFDPIRCGYAAFEALFAAFDRLHQDAPLRSIEVAGGLAPESSGDTARDLFPDLAGDPLPRVA